MMFGNTIPLCAAVLVQLCHLCRCTCDACAGVRMMCTWAGCQRIEHTTIQQPFRGLRRTLVETRRQILTVLQCVHLVRRTALPHGLKQAPWCGRRNKKNTGDFENHTCGTSLPAVPQTNACNRRMDCSWSHVHTGVHTRHGRKGSVGSVSSVSEVPGAGKYRE